LVHIAGSKGKGTTAWLTATLLEASGLKTGLAMSPHLVDETERALVALRPVAGDGFWESVLEVAAAFDKLGLVPTYSGAMSLAAMQLFRRESVEVAVIECGLGGIHDATGFLGAPVCALTGLELEHVVQLGDTLEEIAAEKAAIAGRGAVLFEPPFPSGPAQVVERICRSRGAVAEVVEPECAGHPRVQSEALASACARAVCERLSWPFAQIDLDGIVVPGRLDLRATGEGVTLFDGAHTANSIAALARELPAVFTSPAQLIFSASPPRDAVPLMAPLISVTADDRVFVPLTSGAVAPAGTRAASAEDAASLLMRPGYRVVTGSFHLVGQMMKLCGISPFEGVGPDQLPQS
jgi:folylpolyglutamate synthase/dihydropteroate synthase